MSIKSLFCSITALVASSMGISLGTINSLKTLQLILSYPSPKQKNILLETLNIWRSLQKRIQPMNLCNSLLHKFRGAITLPCWIRSQAKPNGCGMQNKSGKTVGRATFSSIRLRVDYISVRRWLKRCPILNCGCLLRRVSLLSRR